MVARVNRRALVVIVLVVVGVVGALAAFKYWRVSSMIAAASAFGEPAEAVQVAAARPITWQAETRAAGTIVARQFVTLSNELPGTVARVDFRSGQVVEEGQLLLELDTRTERAELRSAEADIGLAKLTAERTVKLVEQKAGAQAEVDRARAQLTQAEARRDVIAAAIARKVLRAPFRGRIGLRDVHPGQYLAEGTELTTLESVDDSVYVDFRLPQEAAARLAPGAEVRIAGGSLAAPATAVVRAIDARADEASRTVRVRAEADAAGNTLKPGTFVDVTVGAGAPQSVLAVPLAAVRRAAYGDHVYVIGVPHPGEKGPRAEQRFVRTGSVVGTDIVIVEGLAPGERVATEGSFKLRQGSLVQVTDAAPAGAPGPAGGTTPATTGTDGPAAAPGAGS
jgi:membrane fusion protein (multidrug efflux system)